jgi:hypothetical protein
VYALVGKGEVELGSRTNISTFVLELPDALMLKMMMCSARN